ncbi:GNAT family N-acetyltransferase [Flexivirga alba]|uniref:GNAT family N-acetyltransferase n=1 Tax=Flexivirga alba TaxID=702742 RepID=A0ABW2ADE8_9MICO
MTDASTRPVTLRAGTRADIPALTAIYNHYVEHTVVTFDTTPFTPAEREAGWFVHYAPAGRHRLLVAETSGDVVGYATSSPHRPKAAYETSVETTIYLHPDATGRGIGRILYAELLDSLQTEDVHRALAGVALPNDASTALHERLGFTALGTFREVGRKFGRYVDVRWFERPIG